MLTIGQILATLAVTVLAVTAPPTPPAAAQPDPPPVVTIVLTSDAATGSAVWFDAAGQRRRQDDLPLPHRDPESGLWSGSLTYTADGTGQARPAVVFVADGGHAGCAVFVGEKLVTEDSQDGPHATAICL
nr:hypothetical protein ISGA_10540 [Gordonia sp. NB41Y]